MKRGLYTLTTLTAKQPFTRNHLVAFHKLMLDNGDIKNADKIIDLYKKQEEKELVISFAGHFSAGKSSMINALLDKDILPKSPIPTSANIVKITSGDGVARIYFHHDDPIEYKEPYDIDMIKEYGKDKDTIKSMELSTSEPLLPSHCSIVDTPGIDAADDADRLMTESSLHLVDVLFYVMDYNHVQSEVNLYFLKNIQDMGIPFYIIINQVDKHDETELPFRAFASSVDQTFQQWDIIPEEIYFSSLIDDAHQHNQFIAIKEKVFVLFGSEQNTVSRIEQSALQIVASHKHFLQQNFDEKTTDFEDDFTSVDEENLKSIQSAIESVQCKPEQITKLFQDNLQMTLKNAYLMPSDLRDKAASFLESQQKDFKVGLFGSKKKTNEEKNKRMETFLVPLQKNIEASIQWKLRDKFIKILKENEISDPIIMNKTQQLMVDYRAEDLLKLIKTGAQINGDYVLNYTNDVSTDIKNKFKRQARELLEMIVKSVGEEIAEETNGLEKQRDQLKMRINQLREQALQQEALQKKLTILDNQFVHPEINEASWESLQERIDAARQPVKQVEHPYQVGEDQSKKALKDEDRPKDASTGMKRYSIDHVSQSIEKTIQTVEKLPGFQSIVNDLKEKQQRLDNRTLTIALFGAFSAGKSSFANALLGEGLLPSSPNPTTAVINRISPVTDQNPHGTVVIQLKDEGTLVNDLMSITRHFSPPKNSFEDLLSWAYENKLHESNELNKLYQAYLQAMFTGYNEIRNYIGEKVTITLEEFANFVTDEAKACYMESIDLYYDCPLTRQGITLVDTPGADSVNARHTNVAFDYIKYADAILYVTYYNHALSRADKDFLLQLGRVKDTFQLDKMFFIINAADLAESETDLQLVMQYVEEQLLQLGIRFPKVYPVSSKQSLKEKLEKQVLNTEMQDFEKAFYSFIHNDLAYLSMESALLDIYRAYQTLSSYIKSANLNEQEKRNYRDVLLQNQNNLKRTIDNTDVRLYDERIAQKIEKQLHYVKERFSIRYHDIFKEMFNPTTITESGKKATSQLQRSLVNLLDYAGYELLQELRAVSLRIEAYLSELEEEVYQGINNKTKQIDSSFTLPSLQINDIVTPGYEQAFTEMDIAPFNKVLSRFKGTKAFFAKNEKELMKEDLYLILSPFTSDYINQNAEQMKSSYFSQWTQILETMKQELKEAVDGYVENNLSVISDKIDMDVLKDKQQKLSLILEMFNKKEV